MTATGNGGAHGRTWIVYNMCIVYRGAIRQTFCVLVIIRILFYYLFIVYFVLPHPAVGAVVVRAPCLGLARTAAESAKWPPQPRPRRRVTRCRRSAVLCTEGCQRAARLTRVSHASAEPHQPRASPAAQPQPARRHQILMRSLALLQVAKRPRTIAPEAADTPASSSGSEGAGLEVRSRLGSCAEAC